MVAPVEDIGKGMWIVAPAVDIGEVLVCCNVNGGIGNLGGASWSFSGVLIKV